jgi:hypothetical protein
VYASGLASGAFRNGVVLRSREAIARFLATGEIRPAERASDRSKCGNARVPDGLPGGEEAFSSPGIDQQCPDFEARDAPLDGGDSAETHLHSATDFAARAATETRRKLGLLTHVQALHLSPQPLFEENHVRKVEGASPSAAQESSDKRTLAPDIV